MITPLRSGQTLLIPLGAMLSLLPATRAQVPFDISPYAGLYAPLGSLFVPGNCGGASCRYPIGGGAGQLGQTVALQQTMALRTHQKIGPPRPWGVEGTVASASSRDTR